MLGRKITMPVDLAFPRSHNPSAVSRSMWSSCRRSYLPAIHWGGRTWSQQRNSSERPMTHILHKNTTKMGRLYWNGTTKVTSCQNPGWARTSFTDHWVIAYTWQLTNEKPMSYIITLSGHMLRYHYLSGHKNFKRQFLRMKRRPGPNSFVTYYCSGGGGFPSWIIH